MKKIVWENSDGSIIVTTLIDATDHEAEKDRLIQKREEQRNRETLEFGAPISESRNHVGFVEEKDLPNAAQPIVYDTDGLTELEAAKPETVVEDYTVENGAAVKKPVMDNIKHLRGSWRWDAVNNKIIEDPAEAKNIRSRNVRAVRNQLLKDSDQDEFRLTGQALADARSYRASLRDLGSDIDTDPENVNFPVRS